MFSINGSTGEIQTLVVFDREDIDSYSFTVSAQDGGSPPTSTDVLVVVTVGDVNDNDPYFIQVPTVSVEVFEVSTSVHAVTCHETCTHPNMSL